MTEHNNPAEAMEIERLSKLAEANGQQARFWADHFAEVEKANRDALGAHHKPGHSVAELITALTSRLAVPADRPPVVCLCGSMRFEDEIREAAREESIAGHIVVLPLCNMKQPHPLWNDDTDVERIKVDLDSLHKAKIDLADEIVVVSDASGYVGDSTRSEIAYAEAHGKPVRYWSAPVSGSDTTEGYVSAEKKWPWFDGFHEAETKLHLPPSGTVVGPMDPGDVIECPDTTEDGADRG